MPMREGLVILHFFGDIYKVGEIKRYGPTTEVRPSAREILSSECILLNLHFCTVDQGEGLGYGQIAVGTDLNPDV